MSRIGKKIIEIPAGVTVAINGDKCTVSGSLGSLTKTIEPKLTYKLDGQTLTIENNNKDPKYNAYHGLYRQIINNMVIGVTEGYSKKLVVSGVGYRVAMQGKALNLTLGYSHPVVVDAPEGISFETPDANTIIVKGIDKQVVGETAAYVRSKRAPEPYKGKGIKYEGERIRRKSGKTGK